jgi:hypothetical protein
MDLDDFVTKSAEAYKRMKEQGVRGQQRGEYTHQVMAFIATQTTDNQQTQEYIAKYYKLREEK